MRRGQSLIFFAIALPAILLPLAALAAEGSLVAARQARLSEATAAAATAGALALDAGALRAGSGWRLDAGAAGAAAASALAAVDPAAILDQTAVSGRQLTVTAHEFVHLQLAVFTPRGGLAVRATATAALTPGYSTPG